MHRDEKVRSCGLLLSMLARLKCSDGRQCTVSIFVRLQISEEVVYAVRQPTAHAINENHRVRCFRQMLLGPLDTPDHLLNLGDLMYQVTSQCLTMTRSP